MKKVLIILLVIMISCGRSSYQGTTKSIQYRQDTMNADGTKVWQDSVVYMELEQVQSSPVKVILESSNQGDNPDMVILEAPKPTYVAKKGTLVYKVDSLLTIGVISRVEARIIKQVSVQTSEQLVALTTHTSTGVIKTKVIKVGNIMDMDLISLQPDAFTITKVNGEQEVDEETITEWIWGVTANKVGDYDLILKASVKGVQNPIIVFDKKISVKNKPKKKYLTTLEIPSKLKRFEESSITLTLVEAKADTYNILWGGNGKVDLDFGDGVKVTEVENYNINDDKSLFEYKWIVEPTKKDDSLSYKIKIIGDYEEEVLYNNTIGVKMNFKESFNRFIDVVGQRWYWIFTALLIPIYNLVQKKYFPEKRILRRKKKKTN